MKMNTYLRSFFVLFAFFVIPIASFADHITVQGEVSGAWSADTVFAADHLLVPDGALLTISPGTRVIFLGVFELKVDGALQAIGTANDSIYFTMADTAGFAIDTIPGGGWGGVRFDRNRLSNDSSIFDYCHFQFGKVVNPDPEWGHGGALFINDYSKVSVRRCSFADQFATYNGGAIYLDSANVSIHHCSFTRNRCGLDVAPWGYGGAIGSDNSSPDIRWNAFIGNSSTGIGGAVSIRYTDGFLLNNLFLANFSALGGALGVLHIPECTGRISNNLFAGNSALYFGGGVASINASPYYINNTITGNSAIYGGGFYCKDSISPDFYNTIIWGNTAAVGPQGYLFEVYSQADFFNCDVEGGPALFGGSGGGEAFFGAFETCIDLDPRFLGSGEHPYALADDSPCYDAGNPDTTGFLLPGTDLAGNPRISHGFIDMGAYEVMWTGVEAWEHGSVGAGEQGSLEVWPNPTRGQFKVQSSKFKVEFQSFELIDIFGNLIETPNLELWNPGILEFDISHLPDGLYLLRIYSNGEVLDGKILKVSR
jgi:hypothetical protein